MLEGERSFDLVVRMKPRSVTDIQSIRNIPVFGSNGERVTLGTLAAVEVRPGMARIDREENERRTAVKLSVRDRDLGSLVKRSERSARRSTCRLAIGWSGPGPLKTNNAPGGVLPSWCRLRLWRFSFSCLSRLTP